MDLIKIFGDILAHEINRDPLVCKGLIRLSLKDQFGSPNPPITYDSLRKTFENSLKSRLNLLNFPKVETIITNLLQELDKKQALFTLSQF